jgi:hypothetical protein
VRQVDRLSLDGPDQRHVDIAELVDFLPPGIVGGQVLLRVERETALRAAHRHQILELVAAVDVEALRDRPEPMRRVPVAVVLGRMRATPEPFALRRELD